MDASGDSFGGSIYRRRRRSGPLAGLLRILFYASSLAPAAWIVWHYDLINRVDRQLKGEPEEAATTPEHQAPKELTPASPMVQRPRAAAQRDADEQQHVVAVDATPRSTDQPGMVDVAPRADVEPNAATKPVIVHTIDLDLSGRRQRFPLPGTVEAMYRVATVEGCPTTYAIKPTAGQFGQRKTATVIIDGRREVQLRVTVETGVRGTAIVVEPVVETDGGKEIPFILANMQKIRQRVMKQGADAADELAAIEAEGSRLMAWIAAPVVKPLAEVGQAKARVVALESARVQQAAAITALEADLAVAEAMEKLARQLHAQCKLGVAVAEPSQSAGDLNPRAADAPGRDAPR